jgi:hypothetical protein
MNKFNSYASINVLILQIVKYFSRKNKALIVTILDRNQLQ